VHFLGPKQAFYCAFSTLRYAYDVVRKVGRDRSREE